MRRSPSIFLTAAAFAFIAACAQGMESEGDNTGDDTSSPDANEDLPIDARPPIDAAPPIDANIPIDSSLPVDAPVSIDGGGGLFCTSGADCPAADDCCFSLSPPDPGFCVPGTEIAGVCFPIS